MCVHLFPHNIYIYVIVIDYKDWGIVGFVWFVRMILITLLIACGQFKQTHVCVIFYIWTRSLLLLHKTEWYFIKAFSLKDDSMCKYKWPIVGHL